MEVRGTSSFQGANDQHVSRICIPLAGRFTVCGMLNYGTATKLLAMATTLPVISTVHSLGEQTGAQEHSTCGSGVGGALWEAHSPRLRLRVHV